MRSKGGKAASKSAPYATKSVPATGGVEDDAAMTHIVAEPKQTIQTDLLAGLESADGTDVEIYVGEKNVAYTPIEER